MGIKTCIQGHQYDDSKSECPHCPKQDLSGIKTVVDGGGFPEPEDQFVSPNNQRGTLLVSADAGGLVNNSQKLDHKGTIIADYSPHQKAPSHEFNPQPARAEKKLVGWVVSFSWNPQGDDHRIRKGRTKIGSDPMMDIVINDGLVSGKHAILIYRSGKLKIRDEMSVNGTFVNDEDIGDDPTVLKDGDIIRFGTVTEFKLRLIDIEEESS